MHPITAKSVAPKASQPQQTKHASQPTKPESPPNVAASLDADGRQPIRSTPLVEDTLTDQGQLHSPQNAHAQEDVQVVPTEPMTASLEVLEQIESAIEHDQQRDNGPVASPQPVTDEGHSDDCNVDDLPQPEDQAFDPNTERLGHDRDTEHRNDLTPPAPMSSRLEEDFPDDDARNDDADESLDGANPDALQPPHPDQHDSPLTNEYLAINDIHPSPNDPSMSFDTQLPFQDLQQSTDDPHLAIQDDVAPESEPASATGAVTEKVSATPPADQPRSGSRFKNDQAVHVESISTDTSSELNGHESAARGNYGQENATNIYSAKIMIVDDEPINIKVLRKYLSTASYENFVTCSDAQSAISIVRQERPDLLLLDVVMPNVNGLDILAHLRQDKRLSGIPIIILTASSNPKIKTQALEIGATDFLAKPVDPSELILRVRNVLTVKEHQDHLAEYTVQLEREVTKRTKDLAISRQEVVECLARAAEFRDESTGQHIVRVGKIAAMTARALGMPDSFCYTIEQAAQLHDVGKIAVPDDILRKPGRLDQEEYELMKRHCFYGQKILQRMTDEEFELAKENRDSGNQILESRSSELIRLAARIAMTHHERWDGEGYPYGLAGEDIPIEGRITAVADVYDALSSKRVYKPAFSPAECVAMIQEQSGSHFDPRVVRAFMTVLPEVEQLKLELHDEPTTD